MNMSRNMQSILKNMQYRVTSDYIGIHRITSAHIAMHNVISGHRWLIRLLHAIVWESVAATWDIAAFHTITLHSDAWWFLSMLDPPSLQHSELGQFGHLPWHIAQLQQSSKTWRVYKMQLGALEKTTNFRAGHETSVSWDGPPPPSSWSTFSSVPGLVGPSSFIGAKIWRINSSGSHTCIGVEGFGGMGRFLQIGL